MLGSDCRDNCFKEGVVYIGECNLCNDTKSVYIGESSRTIYTRSIQHLNDFNRAKNRRDVEGTEDDELSSWIADHMKKVHSGEYDDNPDDNITFSVLSYHQDPFTRQTAEGVRIQQALDKGEIKIGRKLLKISSLNRRGEYFAAKERWDSRRRVI